MRHGVAGVCLSFEKARLLTRTSKLLEIYFSLSPNACLTFHKAYSEPLNTPTLHINQIYGRFTLWHSVGRPTGCWLYSHQFLVLHCGYLFINLLAPEFFF